MNANEFIELKKMLYIALIDYIDSSPSQMEEYYQNVIVIVDDQNIRKDKQEFKLFIYLISNIANNHHRTSQFISKIEKILQNYKNEIRKFFTNKEIFDIFQRNKRVLLFLFKQKLLHFDESIINMFKSTKYSKENYGDYFAPEINDLGKTSENLKIPQDFDEKRSEGENDNYLCQLNRNDQINEFNKNIMNSKISLTSKIMTSIYETNSFLLQNIPSLIEYAAFFGSINIFKYLLSNGAKITQLLWIYAIHGNNFEIFHILEEKCPLSDDKISKQCIIESIKCHHNDIANYFLIKIEMKQNIIEIKNRASIENYNFSFFPNSFNENYIVNLLCEYDYYSILKILLSIQKCDVIKLLEIAKKNNLTDIAKLLLLSTPNDIEEIKFNSSKLMPFKLWEQHKDGKIKLTEEASKRISSSNHPCLIFLFGPPRTGKSTNASHLASGPESDLLKTVFKTAASSKSCTHMIHSVGPIKCKEFASMFGIKLDTNINKNRDIFIIDSEGLDSIDGETAWLKQAIISTLPLSTVSLYVSKTIYKNDLDFFMKCLKLERVIGGIEIHHGLGYIINKATYDGSNVMEQLIDENEKTTNNLINEFQKSSIIIDDSHFKFFSVVSFYEHKNEYFNSIAEVSKFIVNLCLNEGTVLSGPMVVNMLDEMADKATKISDFTDINKSFEIIFNQVLENAMKQSINDQIPQIEFDIINKLTEMPVQELKLLDINNFMKKIENSDFIQKIISKAVERILPDLPQSFPVIYKNSESETINIVRGIIEVERSKLIFKEAIEIYNLGSGFSILDGIFKNKVFDLPFSSRYVEKKLNNNAMIVCHIHEKAVLEPISFDLQEKQAKYDSTFENLIYTIVSSFRNEGKIGFLSKKFSLSALSKLSQNLFGFSYSMRSPQNNIISSLSVNLLGKVYLKEEKNMEQFFVPDLQMQLNELEEILNNNDIKSPHVKEIISNIYSNYGESIAMGFFIGNYELDVGTIKQQNLVSGGQGSSSTSRNSSSKVGLRRFKHRKTHESENTNENSAHSEVISTLQDQKKVKCGSSTQPSIFIYDIASSFVGNTAVKSTFIPLFKFVKSDSVAFALNYWAGRWKNYPETYAEYCYINDIKSIPVGQIFQLYHDNRPYDVMINNDGDTVIPDSIIEYTGTQHFTYDVVLDPQNMTISGFKKDIRAYHYVSKHCIMKTERRYEFQALYVKLSQFWVFDEEITEALFKGKSTNFLKFTDVNPHSFKVEYYDYYTKNDDKWSVDYFANLQQNIKVRLA